MKPDLKQHIMFLYSMKPVFRQQNIVLRIDAFSLAAMFSSYVFLLYFLNI